MNSAYQIARKAAKPSNWDINFTSAPFCWTQKKAILIGDAIHSVYPFRDCGCVIVMYTNDACQMFPTTGQGACQSLEDAAALGIVLSELKRKSDLATRLQTFQKLRHDRVMAIHTMSSVLVGQETRISEKSQQHLPEGKPFSGPLEHLDYTNSYVY